MDYSKVKYVKSSVDGIGKISGKVFFTKDKVYRVKGIVQQNSLCDIINNFGQESLILIHSCAHLHGKKWIPCTKDGIPL